MNMFRCACLVHLRFHRADPLQPAASAVRSRHTLGRTKMSASGIRQQQILLIVATLAIGLAADVHTGFGGQYAISAGFWGVLFYLFGRVDRDERRAVMACLVIATAGEIFCSLVWGLYTYR